MLLLGVNITRIRYLLSTTYYYYLSTCRNINIYSNSIVTSNSNFNQCKIKIRIHLSDIPIGLPRSSDCSHPLLAAFLKWKIEHCPTELFSSCRPCIWTPYKAAFLRFSMVCNSGFRFPKANVWICEKYEIWGVWIC